MYSELIIISEYCVQSHIDTDFITQLENEGLVEISIVNNMQSESQSLKEKVRLLDESL